MLNIRGPEAPFCRGRRCGCELTATEIQNYNNGATLLARTDNPSQQGTNFHKMTRGRGTLVVSGLDTLVKPTP